MSTISGSYTYDDGRVVTQREDGSWVNEYGEGVADPNDPSLDVDLPGYTDGNAGSWESGGSTVYGAEGDAAVAHGEYVDPHGTDYEVTVGGLSGSAYAGEDEASLGFTANVVEFEAQGGEWDANQAGESRLSGGLSVGAGAGGHATYGTDHDGDGRKEYGVEVDALFFSVGYVTEEDHDGQISTLDDKAYDAAAETYNDAADYASETYNDAAETATETYNDAAETATETYNDAAEYASETYNDAADYASETYNDAAETASETYNDAAETASETYNDVVDYFTDDDE
jgi:hypothetical protein